MAERFSPPSFWSGISCQVGQSPPSLEELQSCSCCHHLFWWLVERGLGSSRCFPQERFGPSFLGVFAWEMDENLWSTKPLFGLIRNESVLCCIAGKCHVVRKGPVFLRPPSWDWSRFYEIWVHWLMKKEGPAVWLGHGVSMSVNECLSARESEDSRRISGVQV